MEDIHMMGNIEDKIKHRIFENPMLLNFNSQLSLPKGAWRQPLCSV